MRILRLVALALLCPLALSAQQLEVPPIPIDTFSLDNGLKVVVSEDHSTPVVAVHMWYHIGSAVEEEGRSGFAHLFEHMLFEETENIKGEQFREFVNEAGGTFNGSTTQDRTNYFEIMPSNRVNLSLWLHAERMGRLVVSEENFENQREVVKEERRQRIDNQPYGKAILGIDTLATDYEPYKHTVIGTMDDLNAATAEDVRSFYERYYVPNNAVLTVVGDVTTDEIREMAEKYFGDFERGPEAHPYPPVPPSPRTDGERRAVLDDPLAQLPLVYMAYNVPPADHPDRFALNVLSNILSDGESSRLYRVLVKEEQVAPTVFSGFNLRRGPGTFVFGSLPNQGIEVSRIEDLIFQEVDRVKEEGVSDREVEKAVNNLRAGQVRSRLTVNGKANAIQNAILFFGDPYQVNRDLAEYESVTPEEVRRVARKYLIPENRTVIIARPARAGADR
ncbi:MAG: pitrilysin family protein [Gemmatimonadota bacterium]|jgi:predicted Zn-dependent peptidase